ncbi:MAG TPA: DUF4397 domain-containing protein [Candidatus Baltobacteraceae bacterium]|nr:DUF4397 domain-containing protein [Candidatus Baltobacteraceae bacterium]
MQSARLAALAGISAVLSLSACGGGGGTSGPGFANVTGSTANVRFINGNTTTGSVDVYLQSTGSAAPSAKIFGPLAYGEATDYMTEPAVAGTVIAQTAGGQAPSTGAKPLASCNVPAFTSGSNYTIVFAAASGVADNCLIFQDANYTGSPQIRVHDASTNAANAGNGSLGFGTIQSASAPAGTPFSVLVTATLGQPAISNGAPASYTLEQPTTITPPASGSLTFAVGANAAVGTTENALATLDSRSIFTPGSFNQPNTTGALNYPGSTGTSLFALDCTAASISSMPAGTNGVTCNGGVALFGYTDSH